MKGDQDMSQKVTVINGKAVKGNDKDNADKLSPKQFTHKAIVALRKEGYKGIHSVFSGFNAAVKEYFGVESAVPMTQQLADAGDIVIIPAKRGVMLYLPGDIPARVDNSGATALAKIFG